jgi:hypothetical protein
MAVLTPTKIAATEFGGDLKLYICTATLESASDTITFVAATHKFRTIYAVIPYFQGGMDAEAQTVQASFSGLTVTLVSKNAAGAGSSAWTDTVVRLVLVVGSN